MNLVTKFLMAPDSFMRRSIPFRSLLTFGFLLTALFLYAQIPEPPDPPRLVNDFSGTLSSMEVDKLEQKLRSYNDTTSTQIVVVLVSDLEGNEVGDFAFRIGERWGIGQSGTNNGALMLIKPKTERSRGKAFIATGYGLEGVIPDALAKRIVEKEMIPSFQQGDYYGGIDKAIDTMIGLASGQYTAEQYNKEPAGAWFIPIIIIILVIFLMKSSQNSNHIGGSKSNLPFWTALFLASQAGRSHSGSWGNFSGGSQGFGGGGGFGGFGGGSFGGGGAGGSW